MRKWYVIALVVMALFLAGLIYVTSEPRANITPVELALREVLAPVQSAFAVVTRWTEEAASAVVTFPRVREENRQLRQRVAVLEAELFVADWTKRENDHLRELMELEPLLPPRGVVARVIGRSVEHWFSAVTINRGERHGLRPGLPVVEKSGAVGHIESVTPNTARVILLVDSKSAVGGMVEKSGMPVIVEGTGDPTGRQALVQPLERGFGLSVGDEIITSGMSRTFPRGVPIGRVEHVQQKSQELRSSGILKPYVDFLNLNWVIVIIDPTDDVHWPDVVAMTEPSGQGADDQ